MGLAGSGTCIDIHDVGVAQYGIPLLLVETIEMVLRFKRIIHIFVV
jgi:hypothetical protein